VSLRRKSRSGRAGGQRLALRRNFCQSEIEDFDLATLGDKRCWRASTIAMDDALSVRSLERLGDLDREREQRAVGIGPDSMRCFSVWPSRYSMAMKARPDSSPIS